MFKSYQEIQREAAKVVSERNSEVSQFGKDELIWMYVQGYIMCMQDHLDNERKKS